MLLRGDVTFRLLIEEDLDAVVDALDTPEVARFLCYDDVTSVRWAVCRRWRKDVAGEAMTLIIRKAGRIVGWTGLLPMDGMPNELQTSTFLNPDVWGSGLNVLAKHVLWTATELLGRRRLMFSIDSRNERSQAAAWKLFPNATVIWLAAPSEPGVDVVLEATEGPNAPGVLMPAERRDLEGLLRRHPGWRVWRVPEPPFDESQPAGVAPVLSVA
ncbi:MAG TPA: GNAT family N-acetyltransferase [Clostridia bacterium]|nr:GNAT family N-acetyltransferase [Clostridia bacterium]